ncbi:MAG: hypothetical protein ACK4VW_08430 [Anaerolineales bacterium]
MSLSSLQILANNRNALLLAEMAAWLHDMDRCPDGKPPNCLSQLAQEVKDARRCFA